MCGVMSFGFEAAVGGFFGGMRLEGLGATTVHE